MVTEAVERGWLNDMRVEDGYAKPRRLGLVSEPGRLILPMPVLYTSVLFATQQAIYVDGTSVLWQRGSERRHGGSGAAQGDSRC